MPGSIPLTFLQAFCNCSACAENGVNGVSGVRATSAAARGWVMGCDTLQDSSPKWWPSEGWKPQEQEQRQQRQQQQEQEEGKEYCRQGRGRRLRGKRGNREIRWRKMRRNWTIPEICAIAGFVSGTWFVNPTTVAFHASWVPSFGVAISRAPELNLGRFHGIFIGFSFKISSSPKFFDHFLRSFHLQKFRRLDWKPPKRRANVRESVMSRPGTWCTWTNPTLGHRYFDGRKRGFQWFVIFGDFGEKNKIPSQIFGTEITWNHMKLQYSSQDSLPSRYGSSSDHWIMFPLWHPECWAKDVLRLGAWGAWQPKNSK